MSKHDTIVDYSKLSQRREVSCASSFHGREEETWLRAI